MATTDVRIRTSAFEWNAGWFGCQLGGTAWMLTGGVYLLFDDAIAALACLGGFVVLNAIGFSLWRSRESLNAYTATQIFLFAMILIFTPLIVTLYRRGWGSTYETCLALGMAPALMLLFFFRDREFKRYQKPLAHMKSSEPVPAE